MTGRPGFRRILVAYDGSDGAKLALDAGGALAVALGAAVGVVSVAPERPTESPDAAGSGVSTHAGFLHDATVGLAALGLNAATHEPTGAIGPTIVQVAESFGYDTIVVGSRDLGAVRRAILGSVSDYVATHARATVLIARAAD